MKTIWIATSNQHKVEEFKKMLPEYNVKCLKDLDQKIEIIENGTTFEENAICKAKSLYDVLHQPVISDDSGIEVDAMDKKPGVYSARWMGENTSYEIKNQAIIDAVKGKVKTARYVCVIAYIDEMGNAHTYRGEVEGQIHSCPVGENGFGYDPIFYYPPFHTTLANVSDEMKNSISHRGKALELFLEDLNRGEGFMIHVVLFEPEIPQNTGNIIRTCMATNSILHLIEPLGFSMDEKHLKRSGMDYIKDTEIHIHKNWKEFVEENPSDNYYFMTRYAKKAPSEFDFTECKGDIYLILGKESTGIDKAILKDYMDKGMRLPMVANARSLNLSNCAAIIVYEVLRQLGYPNLSKTEQIKGEDFLENLQLD